MTHESFYDKRNNVTDNPKEGFYHGTADSTHADADRKVCGKI